MPKLTPEQARARENRTPEEIREARRAVYARQDARLGIVKPPPKTKLVDGERIDIATNKPFVNTGQTVRGVDAQGTGRIVFNPTGTITSADLTPTGGFQLPSTSTPTAAPALQGQLEGILSQNQREAELRARTAESDYTKAVQDYLGKGEEQIKLEEEAGIAGKTEAVTKARGEVKKYQNQLIAEQTALRRQTERIRENKEGRFSGAVEQEVGRVEREGLSKQADIALLQLGAEAAFEGATLDLTSAQALIDRKIALKYEPMKEMIDFRAKFLERNWGLLDKAEKAQIDQLNKQDERTYNEGIKNEQRAYDFYKQAAQNGAPDTVQQSILSAINKGDYQQAQMLAGPYQVNVLDRQIKMAQLNKAQLDNQKLRQEINPMGFDGFLDDTEVKKIDASPQGKKVKALGELKQKVQGYKELVQRYGTETPLGGQKTQLDAAFADLKIAYKEAANLGALTGPDVQLLEEAIKPAGVGGFFAPLKRLGKVLTRQGKGNIISGIDTTISIIDRNAVSNINQLYARNPKYSSSWYVQELTNPFNDVMSMDDTEIQDFMSELSPQQIKELKDLGLIQ